MSKSGQPTSANAGRLGLRAGIRRLPRPRISDKRRLIATLTVLLVISFAVTAIVNYQVSKRAIEKSIVAAELPLTSDNLYSEIQKDLIRPVLISSMMGSDTFLRDWVLSGEQDTTRMIKYLREVKDRYGAFTSFFVSDRTRTYYQTEGVLKKVSPDEPRDVWYFRVRNMSAPYEINVDPDMANKDAMTIFINYRVLDYNRRFIGATGVGITIDAARSLITSYQQRYGRIIYFVDRQGAVALVGDNAKLSANTIHAVAGLKEIAHTILRAGSGSYQYESGGQKRLLNVRLIPELNWFLFVEGTADEALAGIRTTLYANLAICLLITALVLAATSFTINRYQSRLEEMATTDKLTGLANRQAVDLLVPIAMKESQRQGSSLHAILMDIDHFKDINDRHGHMTGDKVLRAIANRLRSVLRGSDIVSRWGGEEFLIIVKNVTEEGALQLAEKIRSSINRAAVPRPGGSINLTASLGVAAYQNGESPERLIARADRALYQAKKEGRNRVHFASAARERLTSIDAA